MIDSYGGKIDPGNLLLMEKDGEKGCRHGFQHLRLQL
jgi:hypothetical protein